MGLLSPFLKKSLLPSPPATPATPATRHNQTDVEVAEVAGVAGEYPESEICEPNLKNPQKGSAERFVADAQAIWPGARVARVAGVYPKIEICEAAWFPKASPSIVKEPPFGLDCPPPLLRAAWLRLLEGCPEGVAPVIWDMAVFDLALFFGDWGKLITDYRWTAADVFDCPAGLGWSIRGSPVLSIGKGMAMMKDERVWRKRT